jgi:hypothetical protein
MYLVAYPRVSWFSGGALEVAPTLLVMSYVSAPGAAPRRTSGPITPFEVYYAYIGVGGMKFLVYAVHSLSLG